MRVAGLPGFDGFDAVLRLENGKAGFFEDGAQKEAVGDLVLGGGTAGLMVD